MRATPFSAIPFSTTPFSTVPLSAIPFSALLLIPALAGAGPPPTRYPPDALLSPLTPAVTAHLRAIAARQPRREDVFAKVGCSITASPRFMRCLAEDEADLGPFERLWPALVHFGGGDAAGTDPFRRVSKAAWPGWSVANVLAGGDHSPLEAELSALDPRFALVMFGTNDIERGDVADFGRRLWRLVDRLTDGGVIPILSTIPPRADRPLVGAEVARYNGVIRGLAQGRRVPLIDLNRALRFLSGAGLTRDGVHLDTFRREKQLAACDFTEAALKHGYNTRNLLNLAALEGLRRVVVEGADAPAPPSPAPTGRGDFPQPVPIGALALAALGAVRAGKDGRARRVYRLELDRPTHLEAFVVDRPALGARLALLADLESGPKWLVEDQPRIEASLGSGAWLIVVDGEPQGGEAPGEYLLVARAADAR